MFGFLPTLFLVIIITCGNAFELPTDQKLIVVMLDGCRWDYFTRDIEKHPGFKRFFMFL